MAKRERVEKSRTSTSFRRATEVQQDSRTQRTRQRGQEEKAKLDEEMDAILEEIDGVLETNAEEFVKAYVQHGGQ